MLPLDFPVFSAQAPTYYIQSPHFIHLLPHQPRSIRSITFASIMFPPSTFFLLFLSYAHVIACDDSLYPRAACSSSFTACNPKGAATTNEPPIGTGISSLFVDVVDTIDSANLAKREAGRDKGVFETRASGGSLCCKFLASVKNMVGVDPLQRCRRNHMPSSPGL